MAAALLGLAYALQGEAGKSRAVLEKGEANAPEVRIFDTPVSAVALGTAHLLAGESDEALAFAERAETLAGKRGFRGSEARTLHLIGEVAARGDPPDTGRADTCYRQALALAEQLGMRPLVADCHLGLGRLQETIGQGTEAEKHFTTARDLYREMEMHRRTEPAADAGTKAVG
jgi:tetratricopeptide (TPR) repeat protein